MPRIKQFDKEEVLDKAMKLFWKKGFHATSIQDLVDELGINRASLYSTFGEKQALFDSAFQKYRQNNIDYLQDFLAAQSSVKQGLYLLLELSIQESVQDVDLKGCFVVNTTTELVPGHPGIEPKLTENRKKVEGLFQDFLQQGVATKEIDGNKDIEGIAAYLYTLYSGLKVIAKTNPDQAELLKTIRMGLSVLDK